MPILSHNLKCFYCQSRTSTPYTRGLRQFPCNICNATNYLDERGRITDPPVPDDTTQQPTFQPIRVPVRATSPELEQSNEQLFCQTCLTNQHLYTRSLAEYLPDESHPSYAKFLASYDTYQAGLEKRYPQVCAQCEPRVRARMQRASYAAKTDHLRRMMEISKQGTGWGAKRWSWRRVLLMLGCWAWWGSVLIQGGWHAMGAAQASDILEYDFAGDERVGWRRCFLPVQDDGWPGARVKGSCQAQTGRAVEWALIAALLSFWWNPKLKEKMRGGTSVRLAGLLEHFWLQVVVLTFRGFAWLLLRRATPRTFPPQVYQALHAVMAVFMLLTTIASTRTVQIDRRPQKLFEHNIQPLLSEAERLQQSRKLDFTSQSSSADAFPLHKLSSSTSSNWPDERLTPPPDSLFDDTASTTESVTTHTTADDANTMDWEPTRTSSDARFRLSNLSVTHPSPLTSYVQQQRQPPSALGGPSNRSSPFFGTLPAQPKGITPKGRQVVQPKPFVPPSHEKKENFFASVMNGPSPSSSSDPRAGQSKRGEFVLRQPQFPSGFASKQDDTGLEDLFDRVFVSEEPPEVRQVQAQQSTTVQQDYEMRARRTGNKAIIALVPLAIGVGAVGLKVSGWFDGGSWVPVPPW